MNHIVYRDALFLIVAILVGATGIMMSYLADPSKLQETQVESPGAIIVTVSWPPGSEDVDTWLMGPGEETAVFYRQKSGKTWDLLRDDLGLVNDPTPLNFENAYTRGEPDGAYRINVLCYTCLNKREVPVTVEVKERSPDGKTTRLVDRSTVVLTKDGEERTAIAFTVRDGTIDKGSINRLFERLAK